MIAGIKHHGCDKTISNMLRIMMNVLISNDIIGS